MLLGSVEAGGTKFVCAVGNEDYRILDRTQFPTTTPKETLQKRLITSSGLKISRQSQFLHLDRLSFVRTRLSTGTLQIPRKGWANTNFVGRMKEDFDIPISWTTDVNGSAYGEYVMATLFNEKINSLVYYTIGTGVGAGAIINGNLLAIWGIPKWDMFV